MDEANTVRGVLGDRNRAMGDPDAFMERLARAIGPFTLALVKDFNARKGNDITLSTIAQASRDD